MSRYVDRPLVLKIMRDFARLTGLDPVSSCPKRYLWTDAFAVCNYLGLCALENDPPFLDLALSLIDQVHHTLGRHRPEGPRKGWISGLGEEAGTRHPAFRGLRIGKPLDERRPAEPMDERLEWDRDGQYYHYLTKWMHALSRESLVSEDPAPLFWAIELAKAAHSGFTYAPRGGGPKRMFWKMSIDLSYPVVPSMGMHDPLDGFVTYNELRAAAGAFKGSSFPGLEDEISDMAGILESLGPNLATDDPLGIGGLLADSSRIASLILRGASRLGHLLETLLESALAGIEGWSAGFSPEEPARCRLAFRELGLSIGLSAVDILKDMIENKPRPFGPGRGLGRLVEALSAHLPLRESIEDFWRTPVNRESPAWIEHREINMVMLATSLAPGGFLSL